MRPRAEAPSPSLRARPGALAVLIIGVALVLGALPAALVLGACGSSSPSTQSTQSTQSAQSSPPIQPSQSTQPTAKPVLTMAGNENMGFLMRTDGAPTGFSADLAADIATRMGRSLEVTFTAFSDLLPGVEAGTWDIAMSAISITPEREQQVSFSAPYFTSGQALLVPIGSAIKSKADLKGKTVGVLSGSTNQKEAESIPGIKLILPFDAKEPMFEVLEAGKIDAVICDTPFALYESNRSGKTRVAQELTTGDKYGIAVKKGNDGLVAAIDQALAAARADGTWARLYREYFGK